MRILNIVDEYSAFVEKGSPQQNAFIEGFNGTMRRELLNGESSIPCSKLGS